MRGPRLRRTRNSGGAPLATLPRPAAVSSAAAVVHIVLASRVAASWPAVAAVGDSPPQAAALRHDVRPIRLTGRWRCKYGDGDACRWRCKPPSPGAAHRPDRPGPRPAGPRRCPFPSRPGQATSPPRPLSRPVSVPRPARRPSAAAIRSPTAGPIAGTNPSTAGPSPRVNSRLGCSVIRKHSLTKSLAQTALTMRHGRLGPRHVYQAVDSERQRFGPARLGYHRAI